ncbi:YbfB/YjiJ family MFS transporter [Candidatus Aalborgicola defluviihabitans]|uniref:YbfB/YjiJ family MFS transporter n=1 Tax=Candidatus Aalborgicola defluviihabitans TaxID=3386187 RepID=UPI0039B94FB7
MALFTFAYGLAGFGYIITATFLPVIARQAIPGSPWLDMFWPLFGLGVVVGALVASRIHGVRDLRLLLIACYLIQAVGIATSLISPTLGGFTLGSLLLGLPFTAITFCHAGTAPPPPDPGPRSHGAGLTRLRHRSDRGPATGCGHAGAQSHTR